MARQKSPADRAGETFIVSLALSLLLAACTPDPPAQDAGTCPACPALFGRPSDKTGLTAEQCVPRCTTDAGVFAPPDYDAAFAQSLIDDWTPVSPYPPLAADPYASPAPPEDPPDTVCAVLPGPPAKPRTYTLGTYPSETAARAAGAAPTHFGRCGVCSTLGNLAVYMRENDLAQPVRACGLAGGGDAANLECLKKLGFDEPCAQIWFFNTKHTREKCLGVCLAELSKPYHLPDGSLNPCILCDEVESGPVFKAVAGRTRRNSGLPNALCRPCSEVRPLVHAY